MLVNGSGPIAFEFSYRSAQHVSPVCNVVHIYIFLYLCGFKHSTKHLVINVYTSTVISFLVYNIWGLSTIEIMARVRAHVRTAPRGGGEWGWGSGGWGTRTLIRRT